MHTIDRATEEESRQILALQLRAFAKEGRVSGTTDIPPLAETLDSVIGHIRDQTALVARQGGRIVGSIRGIADGTVCTIRGLGVEPERQGQGIGSSLLAAIEAAHPRASRFELTTNALMPGNVRFYERHGYHTWETTPFGAKIVLAHMRKAR